MYAWIDRFLDHCVRLQSDLRDPARKGSGLHFADLIGPWKAASRAGWRHGRHSTQISRRAAQWRPSFQSRSCKGRLCPWERGRLPHMYLVNSWACGWSRDVLIKSAANHHHTAILVCAVRKYVVICSNVKYYLHAAASTIAWDEQSFLVV